MTNVGEVSTGVFDGIGSYLTLVLGIILAFYIIDRIISMISFRKDRSIEHADEQIRRSERLTKETDELIKK